jgi:hypothetical protein
LHKLFLLLLYLHLAVLVASENFQQAALVREEKTYVRQTTE